MNGPRNNIRASYHQRRRGRSAYSHSRIVDDDIYHTGYHIYSLDEEPHPYATTATDTTTIQNPSSIVNSHHHRHHHHYHHHHHHHHHHLHHQQQHHHHHHHHSINTRSFTRKLENHLLRTLATALLLLAVCPVSGTTNEENKTALASPSPSSLSPSSSSSSTSSSSTSASASIAVAEDTGFGTRSRSVSVPGGGIDLLAALELHNTTRQGVTQVPGLIRLKPAYYLQGEERELRVNEASFERAAALLRRVPEFTLTAALRQEEANSGTIIAFSHGNNRYLELQSSGRKDELRLHYVSRRDGAVHVEAFPFRLADGAWHRVALSISGSQVELLVDCHPLYRRLLRPGPPDTNFTLPQLQLWVGQRNSKHFLFKGALQDVKLIAGPHGYLSQCPQLDSSCPTCGQFSILQNTVEQLMHNLNELTRRLAAAEGRISKVEECECQKSCRVNGTVHEDGTTWQKNCKQCSCVHGDIICRPMPCTPINCKYPIVPDGQCCPICLKQCYLHGVIYDHGERVSPKQCVECDCYDGSFTCQRFDSETRCPPLPCPPSEQISVAEECCKFCPDVDECKQEGGSEGHYCNANTRCVNVIGSYTCECLPGYQRVDKFNCAELDECATGQHSCHEHATCANTPGSYFCVCNDGYTGDGYTCKPVCNQTCQNGGQCTAPDKCSCRRGYIGNSCELDLDECASDLDRCHHSSVCVNMPGWYYCRCKPGYRSALHESNQGTQCLDIDECNDQTIERRHTCHPSATCLNTEGSYQCACPRNSTHQDCRLSCWYENREIANNEIFAPSGSPCRRCACTDGVIECREPICDCSAPGSHRDKCCPQCDPAASCRHQELHHLVFRSGERWIYQCQTCECLYGEIDCWQMECPPVTCNNPVTEDGDCCPRCEDDPCARDPLGNNNTSLTVPNRPNPCSYSGVIYDSGSSWQDPGDKCTTCECKDGQLCCSYDYGCAGDLGDTGIPKGNVDVPIVHILSDSKRFGAANNSSKTTLSTVPTSTTARAPAAASKRRFLLGPLGRNQRSSSARANPQGSEYRLRGSAAAAAAAAAAASTAAATKSTSTPSTTKTTTEVPSPTASASSSPSSPSSSLSPSSFPSLSSSTSSPSSSSSLLSLPPPSVKLNFVTRQNISKTRRYGSFFNTTGNNSNNSSSVSSSSSSSSISSSSLSKSSSLRSRASSGTIAKRRREVINDTT